MINNFNKFITIVVNKTSVALFQQNQNRIKYLQKPNLDTESSNLSEKIYETFKKEVDERQGRKLYVTLLTLSEKKKGT